MIFNLSISDEKFWGILNKINAEGFVTSIIKAGKFQIEHSHMLSSSKRAEILFGSGSGKEYLFKAEMYFERRNSQLESAKQWLNFLVEKIDEEHKKQINKFLSQKGLEPFLINIKKPMILTLFYSNFSPEETKKAFTQLETDLETIGKLKSLENINNFLLNYIDELINRKLGNPEPFISCLWNLYMLGFIGALLLIAILICLVSLGFLCNDILIYMIKLLQEVCEKWENQHRLGKIIID